jgi:hypothetical protein
MSLPTKITAMAAPLAGIALLAALPASAQMSDTNAQAAAAAPKAAANFAGSMSGPQPHAGLMASPMSHAAPTIRPTTTAQAAGTESGSGRAARVANDLK